MHTLRTSPRLAAGIALLTLGCFLAGSAAAEPTFARMQTDAGEILLVLYPDLSPFHVTNFTHLAETGFYNGTYFHRVIPGFMIQGGCPLGTGTGGPGYTFDDEIHPELAFNEPYLLAMANAGKRLNPITGKPGGTNGSQFFITVGPTPHLTGAHTIFGKVMDDESRAVVDKIATTPVGAGDRPVDDVMITGVSIEE